MRLLNTSTLELKEFPGSEIPGYAILSHRWQDNEVTLQDLQDGEEPKMAGYAKIKGCCRQAASDGWKWVWIDSCCIDRTSSAELSETINSMAKWYADSKSGFSGIELRNFHESRWFTRGWTLQELLAPSTVIFFDMNWEDIGTKESLKSRLSCVTGIQPDDFTNFKNVCVARKMSWASKRETTRVEDRAYCLMGLFGINMPTLYGEGNAAFLRLQLEILNSTDDESIFAWTRPDPDDNNFPQRANEAEKTLSNKVNRGGLLANSPADFKYCGSARLAPIAGLPFMARSPYLMTNKSLRMEHHLLPFPTDADEEVLELNLAHQPRISSRGGLSKHLFLSVLNCKFEGNKGNVAMPIIRGWEWEWEWGLEIQPAERITSKLYNAKGMEGLTKKKFFYTRQPKLIGEKITQTTPENATLLLRLNCPSSLKIAITHFWANWKLAMLMPTPEGGYQLSDIPSPSKEPKVIIGAFCEQLQSKFVVFLTLSQGPKVQIKLGDLKTYINDSAIDYKAPKLDTEASSDRAFENFPSSVFVSAAISPGYYTEKDTYIVDVRVGVKADAKVEAKIEEGGLSFSRSFSSDSENCSDSGDEAS